MDALLAGPQDISLEPLSKELSEVQTLADDGKLQVESSTLTAIYRFIIFIQQLNV